MSISDLRSCKYLYLAEIGEPANNELRLVVQEAKAVAPEGERVEHPSTVAEMLSGSRPIVHGPGCLVFELHWRSYVAYTVTNESFTIAEPDTSIGTGASPVIEYSKSAFLDYVAQTTFATNDFPGPLRHWCVYALDHVIDVVSTVDPVVTVRTAK